MNTTPPEPQMVPVPAPLRWGINTAQLPDGTKLCIVQIAQGNIGLTFHLLPHDLKRFAADCAQHARQADTGLILPPGSPLLNGKN